MNPILKCTTVVTLLLFATALMAADYDVIIKKDGKSFDCTIVNETMEAVIYKAKKGNSDITLRWRDVKKITYKGMHTKRWQQAAVALKNGDYETAARQFSQVASGEEVWAQVYGAYHQAQALERAGKYAEVIEALAPIIEKYPTHRMSMYAIFRQGVSRALSDADLAESLKAIKLWNMDPIGSDIEKALVVLQQMKKDFKRAKTKARSLKSRFKSDKETQLYWNITWNTILLEKDSKPDDAIRGFEGLYKSMESKPAARAQISVLLGKALVQVDRADDALYYFLHIDALPFVGVGLATEARFAAAKILISRLDSRADDADKQQTEKMRKRAQGLLGAVVKYGNNDEQALAAQTLLDEAFASTGGNTNVDADAKTEEKKAE